MTNHRRYKLLLNNERRQEAARELNKRYCRHTVRKAHAQSTCSQFLLNTSSSAGNLISANNSVSVIRVPTDLKRPLGLQLQAFQ